MKKTIDNIDELISETLSDMRVQAADHVETTSIQPLDEHSEKSEIVDLEKYAARKRYSVLTVAASIALIAAISSLALISYLNSSSSSDSNKLNTTNERVETTTTSNSKDPNATAQTTAPVGAVTTQKRTDSNSTTPSATNPVVNELTMPPTNFEAYDHYKNAFGWYVKLRWEASTTSGVSYCYFIDLNQMNTQCEYDESFTGTSGDFSVGIGNVTENTFYLRAIKPNGDKSEIITVTYQIPS